MELEMTNKNSETNDNIFTRYVIPAIENKREDFIIKFKSKPEGKSSVVKIITLENQMLIKLKVEITYDRFGEDYGIKTNEIKKLSLYDSLGYKMNLQKRTELLVKDVVNNLIIADIP